MKLRNITDEHFSFEGVTIQPNEVVKVTDEQGQRLLALYWNSKLMPEDFQADYKVEEEVVEVVIPEDEESIGAESDEDEDEGEDNEVEEVIEVVIPEVKPAKKAGKPKAK